MLVFLLKASHPSDLKEVGRQLAPELQPDTNPWWPPTHEKHADPALCTLCQRSLDTKFTETGPYHDEAFAHLRQLGFGELAEKTKANELGRWVRDLLRQPFRENPAA